MTIDVSPAEPELLKKILESYLSELRQTIAATKRNTSQMHAEEVLVKEMHKKLAELQ